MATIARLDHSAASTTHRNNGRAVLPVTRVLGLLGITAADLANGTVTVQTKGLGLILREIARQQPFDPDFYAETYPDIEAARLAGLIGDLQDHFVKAGFAEGRLPSEPPFDPVWYAQYYPDLSDTFPAHDVAGLRNHFLSTGLAEGRAGTAASLAAGRHWLPE